MLEEKLQRCKCLNRHDKDILISVLDTAKIDAERILIDSERGYTRGAAI